MKQVKLVQMNQGTRFRLKPDSSVIYIRGEFVAKEQGYVAFKENDPAAQYVFSKNRKVCVES